MKENLINLVDGCLEAHKTTADPKEAKKIFRLNIEKAYDMGHADALANRQAPGRPASEDTAKATRAETAKQPLATLSGSGKGKTPAPPAVDPETKAKAAIDSF